MLTVQRRCLTVLVAVLLLGSAALLVFAGLSDLFDEYLAAAVGGSREESPHAAELAEGISCEPTSGTVPLLAHQEGHGHRMPGGAVHFILTSGSSRAEPRQLCSIESAALHNPDRAVVVSVLAPPLARSARLEALTSRYPNVQFVRLGLEERLDGTPLGGSWLALGLLDVNRELRRVYVGDLARLATLYKHGGVYLDADVVVLRTLEGLRNAVSLVGRAGKSLTNNFMAFEAGHPMVADVLRYSADHFATIGRSANGPQLLTAAAKEMGWCFVNDSGTIYSCKDGVLLLPSSSFNPVHYSEVAEQLFANSSVSWTSAVPMGSYGVHLSNYVSKQLRICVGSGQVVATLARLNCPVLVSTVRSGKF